MANLSRSAQAAELDLTPWKGRVPQEMLGRTSFPRIGDRPYVVTLPPYGFFWFLLCEQPEPKIEAAPTPHEFTTLVWSDGWASLHSGRARVALEQDVLPGFLLERRWFAGKAGGPPSVKLNAVIPFERDGGSAAFALVSVLAHGPAEHRYLLPLMVKWTRLERMGPSLTNAVAAVRRGPREGSLLDAASDRDFIGLLLNAIHSGDVIGQADRKLECSPSTAFTQMPSPAIEKVAAPQRDQSNTTVIADASFVLKILRRVNEGIHPEIEIGRFLLEQTDYRNVPDFLGSVELVEGDKRSALVVAHRFIENQGDAWTVTGAYLDRFIDEQRVLAAAAPAESAELASYLQRLRQMARRTAELQRALASRPDIPDFAPEPVVPADVTTWTERLIDRAGRTFDLLDRKRRELDETDRAMADRILQAKDAIVSHIQALLPASISAAKIRHHGDFHLGQILVVKDDAVILDFEGEPGRSLAERRQKVPAARDVAGLIRSIDYSTTAALFNAVNLTAEERGLLDPKLDIWREQATEAFWDTCRALTDPALWPSDAAEARKLLDFFLLEKALYEIEYELMNRPAWLHVPLDGTWRILVRHGVVQS
jgi:maltose alpha-D-glucosyltransferase/alpha-amylase